MQITVDLAKFERYWLVKILEDYTDENYNEIACIVLDKIKTAIEEQEGKNDD